MVWLSPRKKYCFSLKCPIKWIFPEKKDEQAIERDRVFRNGKADRSLVKHPKISIVKRRYRCNGIKIAPKSEAHRFRGFRWNSVTIFFGTGWPVARILVKRDQKPFFGPREMEYGGNENYWPALRGLVIFYSSYNYHDKKSGLIGVKEWVF